MNYKAYYWLAKPGIIYGNLITAIAGYFLAAGTHPRFGSLVGLILGISLIIGSACVCNNLADRKIDSKMERTRKRASVTGEVSLKNGLLYALALLLVGFVILISLTNLLCLEIALVGFFVYTLFYTFSKPRTKHATLIGSIAGAAPIVGGYVAYSGHLTAAALVIGAMMLVWQMPHFYAIAIYRESDYKKAAIPVLPITLGHEATIRWMVFYSLTFTVLSLALYFYAPVGGVYLVIMSLVGLIWLGINIRGLFAKRVEDWARRSFFSSLVVILVMSLAIAFR